ncbi:MAG TPA: hypothetical protein PLM79_09580 [Syntrophobacteraceae bacterium]|nr:hypothetical protein [Syntrophobacteraceae bacterium]
MGKRFTGSAMFVLLIVALTAYGCATPGVNLVENRTASVEIISAGDEKAFLKETDVYQDGTELVVTGYVKRKSRWSLPRDYDAHMDMAVFTSDGKLIDKASAGFLPMPRVKSLQSPFTARFQLVAPKGTTVRFAYHRFQSKPSKTFDCGQNAVILGTDSRD